MQSLRKLLLLFYSCITIGIFGQIGSEGVVVANVLDDRIVVYDIDTNHAAVPIYISKNKRAMPFCLKDSLIFFHVLGNDSIESMALYDIHSKNFFPINDWGEKYYIGGFFKDKNWLFYTKSDKAQSKFTVVIFDYIAKKKIKTFSGIHSSLSVVGDCLYFMDLKKHKYTSPYGDTKIIYRYLSKRDTLEMLDNIDLEYPIFDIVDVVSKDSLDYFWVVCQ